MYVAADGAVGRCGVGWAGEFTERAGEFTERAGEFNERGGLGASLRSDGSNNRRWSGGVPWRPLSFRVLLFPDEVRGYWEDRYGWIDLDRFSNTASCC